jgi:hypothetical protein
MRRTPRIPRSVTASALVLLCSCAVLVLTSCPVPFDAAILNRVKDEIAPTITITSPEDGSYCANIVQVDGVVSDSSTTEGEAGGVSSLYYAVLGTTVAAEVTVSTDGSFSFQFTTTTLGPSFTVAITAIDWNNNTSVVSLSLLRASGDGLPSFTVTPGNQSVTLEWDPVPNTASYTLRYTTNGALPSGSVGEEILDVTSPVELTGLVNGDPHVFQLMTVPDTGWPVSASDFVGAVPLSEQTLSPRATGRVTGILVEWRPVPAEDTYEVWRSDTLDGTYVNLSGPVTGREYFDTDVVAGQWYYYKVRPYSYENDLSAAGAAQLSPLTMHEPQHVGTYPSPLLGDSESAGFQIKIYGDYAYVADSELGLRILGVSDPENVTDEGFCPDVGTVFDVAVSGNYAYLTCGADGLGVVNITSKSSPVFVDWFDTPTFAFTVEIAGSYAYVADIDSVQIFSLASPAAPVIVGSEAVSASTVDVVGDYLYLVADDPGDELDDFSVYTLTGTGSPTDPDRISVPVDVDAVNGGTWGLYVDGDYAYIAQGNALRIVDVSDPADPFLVSTCQTSGAAYDVVVDGPYAFVAAESAGLLVINVSDPEQVDDDSIIAERALFSWGGGLGVARKGHYVFTADWIHGVSVMRVAAPTAPTVAGTLSTGLDFPLGVAVRESYAYVADGTSGLTIVDISQADSPDWVTTLDLVDEVDDSTSNEHVAIDVALSGDRAYVADKVKVVDISDPGTPALLGSVYTNGGSWHLVPFGSNTYTSNSHIGLYIVDISVDDDPVISTLRDTTGTVFETAVQGDILYAADDANGLHVFDVSDSAHITEITTFPFVWEYDAVVSIAVSVEDDLAAVAASQTGPEHPYWPQDPSFAVLHLVDVSDPSSPAEYDTNPALPEPQGIDLSSPSAGVQTVDLLQGFAFVVTHNDTSGRLDVYDVSQPSVPFLAGTVTIPYATDVSISGRYAYVTASNGVFYVVDLLPDM